MSISSINTSIASAAQSNQVPNLISSINNAGSAAATSTTSPQTVVTTNPKLNSDWIKIKVTNSPMNSDIPIVSEQNVNSISQQEPNTQSNDSKAISLKNNEAMTDKISKINKTTTASVSTVPAKSIGTPTVASSLVKHKLVSTASTNSNGNIQIHLAQPSSVISTPQLTGSVNQPPTTLTLPAPKNLIKSSNPSPNVNATNTTSVNLTQLTKNSVSSTTNNQSTSGTGALNIPTTVNVNNRKINVGPSTNNTKITLHSSPSSTSSTINNLVKNILSTNSPNNTATTNAAVAVTAAANIFTQMNSDSASNINHNASKFLSKTSAPMSNTVTTPSQQQHPIITTLMTSNTATNVENQSFDINTPSQSQSQQLSKPQSTNQINLPPTTLNINSSQAQNQLPKITVLSAVGNSNPTTVLNQSAKTSIKQPQNRVIQTTSTNSESASNITKTTLPISLKPASSHQHLIPINSGSNGQISNIVSGINLKSLSPISFLSATSPVDASNIPLSLVNTKINNLGTRSVQNATTPPPNTPITLTNNNQPLTISTANISNYISKNVNSMNSGNVYKTMSQIQSNSTNESEESSNNTVHTTVTNNFTNSNSQTIAQLCSLNNQFQIQSGTNGTTIQPIRLIPNNPTNQNQISQPSPRIYQNNVQLQQITLNSSMFNNNNTNSTTNNNNNNNNNHNTSQSLKKGSSGALSNNNISNLPQSSSSPSASPLKPNIIRKTRRDSPSHANLQNNSEHQILNMPTSNAHNQSSIKHPIYELTQNALMEKQANLASSNSSDQQQSEIINNQQHASSQPSSSAISSSSVSASSNSKSIINLIAESSSNDITKSIRKFTLNSTQLNIPPTNTKDTSWASTSSQASSSAANLQQNTGQNTEINSISNLSLSSQAIPISSKQTIKNSTIQLDQPSSSAQPTSSISTSISTITSDKQLAQPGAQNNSSSGTPTSRKRRKQEFKKNSDEQPISYNSNPLSNNIALAYSVSNLSPNTNRYLNENTNIIKSSPIRQALNKNESSNVDDLAGYEDELNDSRSSKKMRGTYLNEENSYLNIQDDKLIYENQHRGRSGTKMETQVNDDEESSDSCLDDETVQLLSKEFKYVASNGVTWTSKRNRSQIAISKYYKTAWKPRNYHYARHSDIKNKDKIKKPKVDKISHKELIENLNEWKFHFVISQVKNLVGFENESLHVIEDVENLMQNTAFFDRYSDISVKINETIKANSQRHRHVNEQLGEAQDLIQKLFDHKEKFKNYLLMSSFKQSGDIDLGASDKAKPGSNQTSKSQHSNSEIQAPKSKTFTTPNSKKGINTRSSHLKNSPINNIIKSSMGRASSGYGSPKSSSKS